MTIVVLALLAGTMSLLPYEITVPIAAVALILYFLSFLFKKSKS